MVEVSAADLISVLAVGEPDRGVTGEPRLSPELAHSGGKPRGVMSAAGQS